jgi:predicted esterase
MFDLYVILCAILYTFAQTFHRCITEYSSKKNRDKLREAMFYSFSSGAMRLISFSVTNANQLAAIVTKTALQTD